MPPEQEIGVQLEALARARQRSLDEHSKARLTRYIVELERWNRRINLIRYRDVSELISRHLADGFAVADLIPASASSLVDIGAGAGIPGAIVAALRPSLDVVALEPTHKKHAFLRSLRRSLPLENFRAFAARLDGPDEPARLADGFDAAVSRATWAVPEWLQRGARLVSTGGVLLALEGRERCSLPPAARRHTYEADGRERAIVLVEVAPR